MFKSQNRSRPLRLHEILKVDGVEKAPKLKVRGKQGATAQLKRKAARVEAVAVEPPPLSLWPLKLYKLYRPDLGCGLRRKTPWTQRSENQV
jgi:hypothetical protein